MTKIRFLVILCIVGVTKIVNAQQRVNKEEVKNAAINTLYKKSEMLKIAYDTIIVDMDSLLNANGDVLMYNVVFENGTAVLLSGSKACQPVLGFYMKGNDNIGSVFDTNNFNVPPGLKALLKDYADEIELCFLEDTIELYRVNEWMESQQPPLHKVHSPTAPYIGPLLTTKWGQQRSNDGDCPGYNYYVTATSSKQCSGENCSNRCPLGCAAVAMGQVMKHWNYPVYWFNTGEQYYDWCNMPPELQTSSPNYAKERQAIARLLKDCADAANTTYCIGKCNSSALLVNAKNALVSSFGYSDNAVRRDRSSYTDTKWKNFIKEDLDNNRPVIYGSLGTKFDGHYWVCDGYDSDDYFSFNWGWNGSHWDGWYTLNGLKGINGSNYRWSQKAIFKIYPGTNQDYCDFNLSLYDYYNSKLILIWTYIYNGYSIPQNIMDIINAGIPKFATRLTSVNPDSYPNLTFSIPAEWHTVSSGQTVEYVAHKEIKLLPGFHAKAGSHFITRIEPCLSCESSSHSMLFVNGEEEINKSNELKNLNDTIMQMYFEHRMQEEILNKKINIFPNPNAGSFTIQTNNVDNIKQIQVINPLGQIIYSIENPTDNNITLPNGAKGTYFVRIATETESVTKKILVE